MALCMSHFENVSDFSLHACFLYFSQRMAILSVVACMVSHLCMMTTQTDFDQCTKCTKTNQHLIVCGKPSC